MNIVLADCPASRQYISNPGTCRPRRRTVSAPAADQRQRQTYKRYNGVESGRTEVQGEGEGLERLQRVGVHFIAPFLLQDARDDRVRAQAGVLREIVRQC